uniref:YccV-like domain-containing protein n=1 Tax=Steinernema glaseri TaxID=37863 RepID=A0A1I7Z6W8_9BILA
MPEVNQFLVFSIICLAVPLQIFLTHSSSSDANYALHTLIRDVKHKVNLYAPNFIRDWLFRPKAREEAVEGDADTPEETVEDVATKEKSNYFGQSTDPRTPRPPFIKYRVGQVVRHKIHGYRGVIIGWDETARAPESWLNRIHGPHKDWRDLPNYTVAIDTRDRVTPQIAYVVEQNIEIDKNTVFHPLVKHYFESFDGKRYALRPALREMYPDD